MNIRGFAESVTHPLVLRRRLAPPFSGVRLYVSSEGGLRYLRPSLARVDPIILDIAQRYVRRGHNIWDIGANLGLFTFTAASVAGFTGSVVAVEADPWLTRLLQKSCAANQDLAPIAILCVAASRAPAVARLNIARRSRSTSFLEGYGSTQTGGVRTALAVPALPLDTLANYFPLPDFLKIDVEGAEVEVLEGATRVLASRPTISIEVAFASSASVDRILRPLGYRYLDADNDYAVTSMPAAQTVAVIDL